MISSALKQLGFKPLVDFICQDDGNGPYIREWLSPLPQPSQRDIDEMIAKLESGEVVPEVKPSLEEQLALLTKENSALRKALVKEGVITDAKIDAEKTETLVAEVKLG